jgi:hypothetical protein
MDTNMSAKFKEKLELISVTSPNPPKVKPVKVILWLVIYVPSYTNWHGDRLALMQRSCLQV